MILLLLTLFTACGPKRGEPPEPPPTDGPAGVATGQTPPTLPPKVSGTGPAPTPFHPSEAAGPPGASVDIERLEHLRGAWRDEGGAIFRIESGTGVLIDGQPAELMVRWCVEDEQPRVCMQVKVPPAVPGGSPYLVLVQEDDDTLVQAEVGERYAVVGPVKGGQRYSRLGPAPESASLPRDVRVQLGLDGEPIYCAKGGVLSAQCDGHYRVVRMIPLFGKVVEEQSIALVGRGPAKGCNPGIRIDESVGAVVRSDLGRIVTPVEPREDHLRRISAATGISNPSVVQAAWVDLDGDRREELVFELYGVPGDAPGYSVVGILRGGSLDAQILEVHKGASAGALPGRVRLLGLVDTTGAGALALLTDVEGQAWVVWGLDSNGMPVALGRGSCH